MAALATALPDTRERSLKAYDPIVAAATAPRY